MKNRARKGPALETRSVSKITARPFTDGLADSSVYREISVNLREAGTTAGAASIQTTGANSLPPPDGRGPTMNIDWRRDADDRLCQYPVSR